MRSAKPGNHLKERDVLLTDRACSTSSWPKEPDMQHIYRAFFFQKHEASSTSIELIYFSSRLYERDILQIYRAC